MADESSAQPPAWWVVDRRAARRADRDARREARAARRGTRNGARPGANERAPVTPERIADAALAIIDREGIDGLTVRALAQALGVGTMTLYWYVQDKDEVLDIAADRLLAGMTLPAHTLDWREAVRLTAIGVRKALLRHARAVPLIVSRGSFGPNGLQLLEAAIGAFRAAGFTPDEAADAYFTISDFVTGFCVSETSGQGATRGSATTRRAFAQRAAGYISLLPPDRFPNVLAAAPRMFEGNRDERFTFGLDALVAGLATQLPDPGRQRPSPGTGDEQR